MTHDRLLRGGMRESTFEHGGMFALVMRPSADTLLVPHPLILYLHGWSQSGQGHSVTDLQAVKDARARGLLSGCTPPLHSVETSIVVAPQCPRSTWWDTERVWDLLMAFCEQGTDWIDRIVVVGVSMGGYAAYELIHTHGGEIASAVIMGGADDPRRSPIIRTGLMLIRVRPNPNTSVVALKAHTKLPKVFFVHGAWDMVVPLSHARRCAGKLAQYTTVEMHVVPLCANPHGLGHHVWRAPICRTDDWWARVLSCET